jgi:glycosyltransferase involved in cell wall biosynthesis
MNGAPLRIQLVIHHELDPNSGAPGSTYRLAEALRRFGHEVSIFSFDDLPDRLSIRTKQVLFPLYVERLFARRSRRGDVDVFDASTADMWVGLRHRRKPAPLVVTTSHGLEQLAHLERLESARLGTVHLSWKYPRYWGGFHLTEVAMSLRGADLALFLNPADLEYAVTTLGVDRDRARIVSNGLTNEFIGLPVEPAPRAADESIGIAQIASYLARKGVKYSAAGLTELMRERPQVRVGFFGTGVPREQVLADFDPDHHDRIEIVERYRTEDLPRLLRGYQIKLLPTLSEGFGVSLIEAMACGLAPVTTSTPGPGRIVADQVTGLLVPPRDSDAIFRALRSLVDDRDRLDELRRSAWTEAQRYAIDGPTLERVGLYREFLAARGAR